MKIFMYYIIFFNLCIVPFGSVPIPYISEDVEKKMEMVFVLI